MDPKYNVGPQERFHPSPDDSQKYKSSSFSTKYFLKTNLQWPQLFNTVVNFQNTWWEHRFWIELVTTGATNSTPLLYTPNQGAFESQTNDNQTLKYL